MRIVKTFQKILPIRIGNNLTPPPLRLNHTEGSRIGGSADQPEQVPGGGKPSWSKQAFSGVRARDRMCGGWARILSEKERAVR